MNIRDRIKQKASQVPKNPDPVVISPPAGDVTPPAKRSSVLLGVDNIEQWLKAESDAVMSQPVSDKSVEQYRRNGARIDATRVTGEPVSLSEFEGKPSTYYAYRAAVRFHAAEFGKVALRDYEKARKAKDPEAKAKAYQRMLDAAADLKQYSRDASPGLPNPKAVALGLEDPKPEGAPTRAKRQGKATTPPRETSKLKAANAIAKKYPDWRERVWNRLSEIASPWMDHAAVAALTGARPDELRFAQIRKDGTNLIVKITGAKVTDNTGQLWREFTLKDDDSQEFTHLFAKATSKLKTVGLPDGITDYPDAFSAALARAGKQVLPKSDRMSGYVYRHALASDLKADGASREQIAAALGHAVTKTQDTYGRAVGGKSGVRSLSVTCAREIKQTHDTRYTNPAPAAPVIDALPQAFTFNTPSFGDLGL
jgi:integrase